MTELSPQAQAIWAAYELADCDPYEIDPRKAGLAAAIETLADQVVPKEDLPADFLDHAVAAEIDQRRNTRAQTLAIAAELRGDATQETP